MKTRVRPDDASMLQLNDWLAALREDGRAEPPGDVGTEPPGGSTEPPADRVRPAASAAGTLTEALSRGCGPAARSGVSRPVDMPFKFSSGPVQYERLRHPCRLRRRSCPSKPPYWSPPREGLSHGVPAQYHCDAFIAMM